MMNRVFRISILSCFFVQNIIIQPALAQTTKLTPELVNRYFNLSERYIKESKFEQAARCLDSGLSLESGLRPEQRNQDLIKQSARVFECWGESLDGDDKIIRFEQSLFLRDSETIRTKLRQAILDSHRNPDSFEDQLSLARLSKNNSSAAIATAYREALRIKDDVRTRLELGLLLEEMRRYPVAIEQLEIARKGIEQLDRAQQLHLLTILRDCYMRTGNFAGEKELNREISRMHEGRSEFPYLPSIRKQKLIKDQEQIKER